eukprot:CAMPEP_0173447874 /NCGR_PEP_ID=MMETSP1357-20121228/39598_1 /TAXON_ID=77926 /ORGANISM="Hemiselmis rufescens, Strain PCC563" /LENGTH=53 /DNA_ID=CAMNT_0014414299 /DNA_START=1 /DNA_END=158 /DNA_ORIENTATION=+
MLAAGGTRVALHVDNLSLRLLETKFVPSHLTSVHLDLPPSPDPYVVLPATYGS